MSFNIDKQVHVFSDEHADLICIYTPLEKESVMTNKQKSEKFLKWLENYYNTGNRNTIDEPYVRFYEWYNYKRAIFDGFIELPVLEKLVELFKSFEEE